MRSVVFLILFTGVFVKAPEISITTSWNGDNDISLLNNGDFLNDKHVVYEVKGQRDATITLILPNTIFWVIVGGWGNTRSDILEDGETDDQSPVKYFEKAILSEYEYRKFWMSWKNGVILVGKGDNVDQAIFMERKHQCLYAVKDIELNAGVDVTVEWVLQSPSEIFRPKAPMFQKVMNCPSLQLIKTSETSSKIRCGLLCWMESECRGFKFEQNKGKCELLSGNPGDVIVPRLYVMRD